MFINGLDEISLNPCATRSIPPPALLGFRSDTPRHIMRISKGTNDVCLGISSDTKLKSTHHQPAPKGCIEAF